MSSALENVLGRLRGVRSTGEGRWQACCPAHDDQNPSLSISLGDDNRVLFHCHSGCEPADICSAMGLALADLFPSNRERAVRGRGRIIITYDYTGEKGELLFQVCRTASKKFLQRRPDGDGNHVWGLNAGEYVQGQNGDWYRRKNKDYRDAPRRRFPGVRRCLYQLPHLLASDPGALVYVSEGEKDTNRLRSLGLVATCNPGGAGKWSKVDDSPLHGHPVAILLDNDPGGRSHGAQVASSLYGKAADVFIINLPDLPVKGDVSDWLDAGHDVQELDRLIQQAPIWEPTEGAEGSDGGPASSEDNKGPQSQATKLVQLAGERGGKLFHDVEGTTFASVPVEGHRETWPIRNRGFRDWLARAYYVKHRRAPNTQSLNDALGVLEGEARYGGPEHEVFVRVGAVGDAGDAEFAIYLDLADPRWRAVRIDAAGWAIVDHPPVRFRRPRGMHPLPDPERGGTIDELRNFVNVENEGDLALIVSWLVAAYWPLGPYPILALHGEQGSAKSTLARILRSLIDPNAAPLRSSPREVRDLMIAAQNGWALVFDNLSRIREWTSDALCRMSTGGGFSTRELYSDTDEVILEATRPVMITGITELGDREDLLDRTIQVVLPTIPEQRRRTERDLWAAFELARPRLLGAMLDAVSVSVRDAAGVRIEALPRMADFAVRAVAAETAMPWPAGTFLRAYAEVRSASHELAIEASSVGQALLAWMGGRSEWSGASTELMAALEEHVDEKVARRQDWPKRPRDLSAALRRLAPTLRALDLEVEFARSGRKRSIHIRKYERASVISAPSVTTGAGAPENAGGGDAEVTLGDAGVATTRSAASPGNCHLAPEKLVGDAGDADDADRGPLSAAAEGEVEWVL